MGPDSIFASDGSANEPVRLGAAVSGALPPVALGNRLLFENQTAWITDGTPGGTRSLGVQRGDSLHESFIACGRRQALFDGHDGLLPTSLWISDGTVTGSRRVPSLTIPFPARSGLANLHANAQDFVVFAATHATWGTEPFVHAPGANVLVVGQGCGAGTRTPDLAGDYDPRIGPSLTLPGRSAAGQFAVIFSSPPIPFPETLAPGSPCLLHADRATLMTWPALPITAGGVRPPLAVPQDPVLFGTKLVVQSALGPTDAAFGFDLTNGLFVTLGR